MKIIVVLHIILLCSLANAGQSLPETFVGFWINDEEKTIAMNRRIFEAEGLDISLAQTGVLWGFRVYPDGKVHSEMTQQKTTLFEFMCKQEDCYILRVENLNTNTSYLTKNWFVGDKWVSERMSLISPAQKYNSKDSIPGEYILEKLSQRVIIYKRLPSK